MSGVRQKRGSSLHLLYLVMLRLFGWLVQLGRSEAF
jgi:hypothetical protein